MKLSRYLSIKKRRDTTDIKPLLVHLVLIFTVKFTIFWPIIAVRKLSSTIKHILFFIAWVSGKKHSSYALICSQKHYCWLIRERWNTMPSLRTSIHMLNTNWCYLYLFYNNYFSHEISSKFKLIYNFLPILYCIKCHYLLKHSDVLK